MKKKETDQTFEKQENYAVLSLNEYCVAKVVREICQSYSPSGAYYKTGLQKNWKRQAVIKSSLKQARCFLWVSSERILYLEKLKYFYDFT